MASSENDFGLPTGETDERTPPTPAGEDLNEITRGLAGLRDGEPGAVDRLVPLLYEDLRRLASQRLRGARADRPLDTAALVHEAYLRLLEQRRIEAGSRADFLTVAARTMRRVLVDIARARDRSRHGGGEVQVPLEEAEPFFSERASHEAIAFDEALSRLEQAKPRAARGVELRFFGGLTLEEIGELLGASAETARRDWEAARAWLRKEVGRELRGEAGAVRSDREPSPE